MLETIHNIPTKKENNKMVDVIKSALSDSKEETEGISEEEIKIERLDEMLDIVKNILEFNNQNQE